MMSRKGVVFVVSGPSGVGKSTLCHDIIHSMAEVRMSVSCTTRSPRPGERDGREYSFVSDAEFRRMIGKEEFAEWAEVYGHLYGTPHKELNRTKEDGVDVILDIDVQGAKQVMRTLQGAVTIFVLPPSLETLQTRLFNRGTDSLEVRERRFQQARKEMRNYLAYQYVIINEKLSQAVHEFQAIILAERIRICRVDRAWLEPLCGGKEDNALPDTGMPPNTKGNANHD